VPDGALEDISLSKQVSFVMKKDGVYNRGGKAVDTDGG
jgi:hypothetical protein